MHRPGHRRADQDAQHRIAGDGADEHAHSRRALGRGQGAEQDVQRHYEQALAYWNAAVGQPLSFDVNNFVYFWAEGPGLLQPYLDEILPQLLQQGKVHMSEKYVKAPVTRYLFADHDINGKNYRIYKFQDGKEILREQDIYTEPVINTTRK